MTRKSRFLNLASQIIGVMTLLAKFVIVMIDLIGKVVNYNARQVRELCLFIQEQKGEADLRPDRAVA